MLLEDKNNVTKNTVFLDVGGIIQKNSCFGLQSFIAFGNIFKGLEILSYKLEGWIIKLHASLLWRCSISFF